MMEILGSVCCLITAIFLVGALYFFDKRIKSVRIQIKDLIEDFNIWRHVEVTKPVRRPPKRKKKIKIKNVKRKKS